MSKELTEELFEAIDELIPEHVRDMFDALRCPEDDGPGEGFMITSVLIDDVPHWGICAYKQQDDGTVIIPMFVSIPPGHKVTLALDPEGKEATHISEEQYIQAGKELAEKERPKH